MITLKEMLDNGKINEAIMYLRKSGANLGLGLKLFIKDNKDFSIQNKKALTNLVRNTLFKNDYSPDNEIKKFLQNKHFNSKGIINFVVQDEEENYFALTQICSLNNEAIFLYLTVVGEDSNIDVRGTGLYRLFMGLKHLYAIYVNHKFIVGRTQNPLALEQYDKHGLFYNPILYNQVHSNNSLNNEEVNFLINRAKQIYENSKGIILTDDLMISSEQVDSCKYQAIKQPAKNPIFTEFVRQNINNADRFFAIKQINDSVLSSIVLNIDNFIQRNNLLKHKVS